MVLPWRCPRSWVLTCIPKMCFGQSWRGRLTILYAHTSLPSRSELNHPKFKYQVFSHLLIHALLVCSPQTLNFPAGTPAQEVAYLYLHRSVNWAHLSGYLGRSTPRLELGPTTPWGEALTLGSSSRVISESVNIWFKQAFAPTHSDKLGSLYPNTLVEYEYKMPSYRVTLSHSSQVINPPDEKRNLLC